MPPSEPPNTMVEHDSSEPIFCDQFEHKLDAAWRIVLPKDWRSLKVTEFFVTPSSVSSGAVSLRVAPRRAWEGYFEVLRAKYPGPENAAKLSGRYEELCASSKRVVPDKEGRLLIPESLWTKIGVSPQNPHLTLRGAYNTFRIWNREAFQRYGQLKQMMADFDRPAQSPQEEIGL